MKNHLFLIINTINVVFLLVSCSVSSEESVKKAAQIDSIRVVINVKAQELKQTDSALISRAIGKFNTYTVFIQTNINDTLNKEEANVLQQFYTSGNALITFQKNKQTLLSRTNLLMDQLSDLIKDANNGLHLSLLNEYLNKEAKAADELIKNVDEQNKLYQKSIQDFKNALPLTEELIRKRNNGQLPGIINDAVNI